MTKKNELKAKKEAKAREELNKATLAYLKAQQAKR